MLLHLVGIAGDDDFVSAEAKRVLLLVRRSGEHDNVGSERVAELHRHVAKPTETNHTDFLALAHTPVAHRRVCRDSSAKQRRGAGGIQIRRDAQNEVFVDDDAFRIATIGKAAEVFVRRIESEDHVRTELFKACFAVVAGAVRIDHATDRDEIACLVLGNCRSDLDNTTDDLMPGNDRIVRGHELAPFVAHRMKIGVTDAAEEDLDLHVAISWITTLDFG